MRNFFVVSDNFRKHKDTEIILPTRSTRNSAGYDFVSPIDIIIKPQEVIKIYSDIKVKMEDHEVFMLYMRSSLGIKKSIMLPNCTGIIDSDYFENIDNDGNIIFALYNFGKQEVFIKKNEKIVQGIFIKYLIIDSDSVCNTRIGGVGSTN